MNNIKYFDEYFGRELEMGVLSNELNEKNKEGGIRGFINRRKAKKVRKELAEEIEMSKNIIDGIKEGLDALSNDFANLDKDLGDDKKSKGENGKKLEEIKKILVKARESSWDINDLIDEGEIDYAGFTGNVGIASARYFGVFLFPFTSSVLVHKGYNYFFTLVRNTIRKALVMLQLNFDQFENLIITKSLQSAGWAQDIHDAEVRAQQYNELIQGIVATTKDKARQQSLMKKLDAIKKKSDEEFRNNKSIRQETNAFDNLDPYNNTYTKSLETLRQYTQEDVQKELDAIKNTMTKLAAGDVDLTAYGELIIAAAEEHAYKVSSSIYNKFAKMTEVFSLPNQAKLLELIKAAASEKEDEKGKVAKEELDKLQDKVKDEGLDEIEKRGKEIFEKFGGEVELVSEDNLDYKVKNIGKWGDEESYRYLFPEKKKKDDEEFTEKLDKEDIKFMKAWFMAHPEVLKECHENLRALFPDPEDYDDINEYIDAISTLLDPTLTEEEEEVEEAEEGVILNFDGYQLLVEANRRNKRLENAIDSSKKLDNLLDSINKINVKGEEKKRGLETRACLNDLKKIKDMLDERNEDERPDWYDALEDLIRYIENVIEVRTQRREENRKKKEDSQNSEDSDEPKQKTPEFPNSVKEQGVEKDDVQDIIKAEQDNAKQSDDEKKVTNHYINTKELKDSNIETLKDLFVDNKSLARVAIRSIGDNIINDKDFAARAGDIVDDIADAVKNKKKKIGKGEYEIIKNAIKKIKDERNHDYPTLKKKTEEIMKIKDGESSESGNSETQKSGA